MARDGLRRTWADARRIALRAAGPSRFRGSLPLPTTREGCGLLALRVAPPGRHRVFFLLLPSAKQLFPRGLSLPRKRRHPIRSYPRAAQQHLSAPFPAGPQFPGGLARAERRPLYTSSTPLPAPRGSHIKSAPVCPEGRGKGAPANRHSASSAGQWRRSSRSLFEAPKRGKRRRRRVVARGQLRR